MSRREEEEKVGVPKFNIISGTIGNPGISVVIKDLYFEYEGTRDPKGIPVGAKFKIKGAIQCDYPEGILWVAAVTAVGGGLELYDIVEIPLHSALLAVELKKPSQPIMPDVDILRLDVQTWASPDSGDFWSPPKKPW